MHSSRPQAQAFNARAYALSAENTSAHADLTEKAHKVSNL
jgi:hypothetical protein